MASRRSQPYRKNNDLRFPGTALDNMMRGRSPLDLMIQDMRKGARRFPRPKPRRVY